MDNKILLAVFALLVIGLAFLFLGQGNSSNPPVSSPSPNPSSTAFVSSSPSATLSASATATVDATATPSVTVTPTLTPEEIESAWLLINQGNVEKACLAQSKQEAKMQGYPDSVVFGCSCTATETAETKNYACQVSALDGNHPASLDCTKSQQSCTVKSQFGTVYYTFEEMRALAESQK